MAEKHYFIDLHLHKQQILEGRFENRSTHPLDPESGQFYFNTVLNKFLGWNGVEWIVLSSESNETIFEPLNGLINNSNATFTTNYNFIPESVMIYVNGVLQRILEDYITIGTNTVIFNFSPNVDENLLAFYKIV